MDRFAKALLQVAQASNYTMTLIHGLLEAEFKNNQVNTILRGNSLATKVESAFCRQVGKDYLKELFSSILLRLVTDRDLDLATSLQ
jgi:hypothetical protein